MRRTGLHFDPGKIETILTLPAPKPVSEVRRIVGMASWYFRYIPNFASIVAPITALLKKDRKFEWSDVCTVAFDTTKQNRTLLNLKVSWIADVILKSTVTRPAISHTVVLLDDHRTKQNLSSFGGMYGLLQYGVSSFNF